MRRLYRSTTDRVFGGVCGGLAAWLGVSPLFVRIMFMLIAMADGAGLALYVALWLLVPSEASAGAPHDRVMQENVEEMRSQVRALGKTRPLASTGDQGAAQPADAGRLAAEPVADGPVAADKSRQWLLLFGVAFVVLGVWVLLDNLGLLWWFSLGKLWPLLLIGLGVVVLLNNLREAR